MPFSKRRFTKRFLYTCVSLIVLASFVIFVIVPLCFLWIPSLMRSFIFVPHEEIPAHNDYKHPENYGFVGGRNFYLITKDGATLGVWHLPPAELHREPSDLAVAQENNTTDELAFGSQLADATVFLYLHGSAGTRTSSHRLRTYKLLNQLGYHVVTLDYRGYGDSTLSPMSESDLAVDTLEVLSWIQKRVKTGNIFFWGHSLGTGVASLAADLVFSSEKQEIKGLILEAPFNNMAAVVRCSSLLQMLSFLPWYEYCFIQPINKNGLGFQSDQHLKNVSTPVLILHAKDDNFIPYRLAQQLYKDVAASRKEPSSVKMISYNSSLGYGHYDIPSDPDLSGVVEQFVEKYSH